MTPFNTKMLMLSIGMSFGAPAMVAAEDGTVDWLVGCCLSPNPIECLTGTATSVNLEETYGKDATQKLLERVSHMTRKGAFDYARDQAAETELKGRKLTSACKPHDLLDRFDKRQALKEISAACNIKAR